MKVKKWFNTIVAFKDFFDTKDCKVLMILESLGMLPDFEPLYCAVLTGKCARCAKECFVSFTGLAFL